MWLIYWEIYEFNICSKMSCMFCTSITNPKIFIYAKIVLILLLPNGLLDYVVFNFN